jgi:hypothetical protein
MIGSAGSTGCRADLDVIHLLLGRSLRHRNNRYERAAFGFGSELNFSVDEREQGVILAKADILAGVPFGAALKSKDIAGETSLTGI